jgi:hypothetical protein
MRYRPEAMLTVIGVSCTRLWVTGGETIASATVREKKQVFCRASSDTLHGVVATTH